MLHKHPLQALHHCIFAWRPTRHVLTLPKPRRQFLPAHSADLQTAEFCTRKVLVYTLSHQNVVLMHLAVSCNGTASNSRAAAHTKRCRSSKWGHVKASWPKLFKRCMKATSRASNIPLSQGGHSKHIQQKPALQPQHEHMCGKWYESSLLLRIYDRRFSSPSALEEPES